MQTKETKENKLKKLSRQVGTIFSSWSIYEELLGQYKKILRPRVIANDQVLIVDAL
jgi:hypothetical protein